jgi:hypothetical protein
MLVVASVLDFARETNVAETSKQNHATPKMIPNCAIGEPPSGRKKLRHGNSARRTTNRSSAATAILMISTT